MKVEVVRAGQEDIQRMENLMHLYLYDFSEFDQADADEDGHFRDEHLPLYWQEPVRHPFLIRVDGRLAGFVLVREVMDDDLGRYYSVAEFFVLRKYRRLGVGRLAARDIFARFPGNWRVAQLENNLPAQAFWRTIIREYTRGRYSEEARADEEGRVFTQVFASPPEE